MMFLHLTKTITTLLLLQSSLVHSAKSLPEVSPSGRALQGQGSSLCNVSTKISCILDDGSNRECSEMAPIPPNQCDPIDVRFTIEYCNNMVGDVVELIDSETVIEIMSIAQRDVDKTSIPSDTCRTYVNNMSINPCGRQGFNVSIKLQGWMQGFTDIIGYYCFSYLFL